jgi:hypothetical protein
MKKKKKKYSIKIPNTVPLSHEEKSVHLGFEENTNPW